MAQFQDASSVHSSDDLVEIDISSPGWEEEGWELLRRFTRIPTLPGSRPGRRLDHRRPIRSEANHQSLFSPDTDEIIDLTGEPEVEIMMQQAPQPLSGRRGRNPRRLGMSAATPTPSSLSRRDYVSTDTVLPNVIDLTADSPAEVQASAQAIQMQPPSPPHNSHGASRSFELHRRPLISDDDHIFGLIRDAHGLSGLTRGFRRIAGLFENSPQSESPSLAQTLSRSFSPREASPKPPMEEFPPVRAGFTRDTDSKNQEGSEVVVVCPACNEELAYDPASTTSQSSSAGGNKKRKRAAGEHHFWALKKCGHVYCADCFENRRPTKTMPNGAGFPGPGGKKVGVSSTDLRCVVEDCETKVIAKTEWVGIFL